MSRVLPNITFSSFLLSLMLAPIYHVSDAEADGISARGGVGFCS